MIKNLIKAAADLDKAGFHVEADLMDKIMQEVAEKIEEETDAEEEMDLEEEEMDLEEEEIDLEKTDLKKSDFGFMGEDEEDAEEDDEDKAYSVEECLEYCDAFSNEEKIQLIKHLLDSIVKEGCN